MLGPNGAGKTTMLKMLATLCAPRAGHENLEALRRIAGRVVAPNELDQRFGTDRPSTAGRQRRQQSLRTIADDGFSPPPHILEEAQRDCHDVSLRNGLGVLMATRLVSRR